MVNCYAPIIITSSITNTNQLQPPFTNSHHSSWALNESPTNGVSNKLNVVKNMRNGWRVVR